MQSITVAYFISRMNRNVGNFNATTPIEQTELWLGLTLMLQLPELERPTLCIQGKHSTAWAKVSFQVRNKRVIQLEKKTSRILNRSMDLQITLQQGRRSISKKTISTGPIFLLIKQLASVVTTGKNSAEERGPEPMHLPFPTGPFIF